MVGGYVLRYALDHPSVGLVTVIGRRKLGISHPKLKEVLHQDFADCTALAGALSDQNAAVFCLGVYTGAVPDAEFRKITVDYTVEFARVLGPAAPTRPFHSLAAWVPTGRDAAACLLHVIKERPKRRCLGRDSTPLHIQARLHLPCGAAEGAEFQLPTSPCYLPCVSDVVPQPSDSGRRPGAGHGGRYGAENSGTRQPNT